MKWMVFKWRLHCWIKKNWKIGVCIMAAIAVFVVAYYHISPHYVFMDKKGYEGVATWCGVKNKELVCDK